MPCPWLFSLQNALALAVSLQNDLTLVVYSLHNTLSWQCTVAECPELGGVQFAECSGLEVYSLQNALTLAV